LDADSGSKFADQREVKNVLIVAITSNRGLCGAFNSNIINKLVIWQQTIQIKMFLVVAIGKKANDALSKEYEILANESTVFDDLTFDNVAQIAELLMKKFEEGSVDKIELVYNKFKNAATQIVTTEQFLPIVSQVLKMLIPIKIIFLSLQRQRL